MHAMRVYILILELLGGFDPIVYSLPRCIFYVLSFLFFDFCFSFLCFPFLRFCGHIFHKSSRDLTRPLGEPRDLKGLLHMLNATMIPTIVN